MEKPFYRQGAKIESFHRQGAKSAKKGKTQKNAFYESTTR
jgi:hypothetical protein